MDNALNELAGVKRAFLGLQEPIDGAQVVVLPVPYDSTTSYGGGTRFGPNAMIDASTQLELYDIELDSNTCERLPVHTLDELALDKGDPSKMMERIGKAISEIVRLGKKPVLFGGEHSVTAGAVAGLESSVTGSGKISVLAIDAHADLRDSYEGTRYSHACAMRRVRETAGSVVQVGIRSMSDEEAEHIKENRLGKSMISAKEFNKDPGKAIASIISQLGEEVYVSVDVDGLDPSVMPGTGTPEPGGLLWEDVLELMKAVGRERKVVGFDIVEVSPVPGLRTSEFAAAKLAYKMMGYFWAKPS